MTQQASHSRTSRDDLAPSPSGSGSSAESTEIYPYSIGDKEIVLSNGTIAVPEDDLVGANPNINVVESSGVRIGHDTVFNGDVTLIQHVYAQGDRGTVGHTAEFKKEDSLGFSGVATPRFRRLLIASSVLLVAVVAVSATLIILNRTATLSHPAPNPNTTRYIENHPVYDRDNWGASAVDEPAPERSGPSSLAIISHTATDSCETFTACGDVLRRLQDDDVDGGRGDIAYNFLVGAEGGIYVGRGWGRENALRVGSVAVAFIGDFNFGNLTSVAADAAAALLARGLDSGRLAQDYRVVGENQTSPKRFYSPGRTWWPRSSDGRVISTAPFSDPPFRLQSYSYIIYTGKFSVFLDELTTGSSGRKAFKFFAGNRTTQVALLAFLVLLALTSATVVYFGTKIGTRAVVPAPVDPGHRDDLGAGVQIVKRAEWLARPPLSEIRLKEPRDMVRIMHTGGSNCSSYQECATKVLALQGWMVQTKGFPDISYNFLVGGDGNVYEGRGADVQNEWMHRAIDIVYLGNYLAPYDKMTNKMEEAGKRLIAKLLREEKITPDYVLVAQNQTTNTLSPGPNIYEKIIRWPHYDARLYFDKVRVSLMTLSETDGVAALLSTTDARPPAIVVANSRDVHLADRYETNYYAPVTIRVSGGVTLPLEMAAWRRANAKYWRRGCAIVATVAVAVGLIAILSIEHRSSKRAVTFPKPPADRARWRGRPPSYVDAAEPASVVVISHTGGPGCRDADECASAVKQIQDYDMDARGLPDIRYNFLVGGDAVVYVGRGWRVRNELPLRTASVQFAFVGDYSAEAPADLALNSVKGFLWDHAQSPDAPLRRDYVIVNENQTWRTDSPGEHLYEAVTHFTKYLEGVFYADDGGNETTPSSTN
ncbi:LOW QUALITY PROTEIN: uncharacterized protein LOC132707648 [Cylas formicarius]|uniref:LOW QUALITY PROTEIN: uncharacterized protein LOC132707648 n=1 Tax=Cylas formicarius TaxID=197179 RepID=UPI002958812D|nr:LOW QUALITY PROTEIN: uncharacterized protein LOC132707648 [Cylas formicarius]